MSTIKNRAVAAALVFLFMWLPLAHADIMYNTAQRSIYGAGTQLEVEEQLTTGMMPFTADLLNSGYVRDEDRQITGSVTSFVSQNSTLHDNLIRGLARGSGYGSGGAEGIGRATMLVDFDVDQDTRFSLAGQLRLAPHGDSASLSGSHAFIRLTGPQGLAMEVQMDDDHLPDNLGVIDFTGVNHLSGIYPAGNYQLEAFTEGRGSDGQTRCIDFDFTLTAFNVFAVPEPQGITTFWSVATLGLLLRRRGGNRMHCS